MAREIFSWARVRPLDPPPKRIQGGGAKMGSKGHKLISSTRMPEKFGSNLLIGGGGGGGRDVLERLITTGPPLLE